VKEAVELYLEVLANEIASGEWIDIKDIGKIQVLQEEANIVLTSFGKDNTRLKQHVSNRMRPRSDYTNALRISVNDSFWIYMYVRGCFVKSSTSR